LSSISSQGITTTPYAGSKSKARARSYRKRVSFPGKDRGGWSAPSSSGSRTIPTSVVFEKTSSRCGLRAQASTSSHADAAESARLTDATIRLSLRGRPSSSPSTQSV